MSPLNVSNFPFPCLKTRDPLHVDVLIVALSKILDSQKLLSNMKFMTKNKSCFIISDVLLLKTSFNYNYLMILGKLSMVSAAALSGI